MPSFTPPTIQQSVGGDRFWSRYSSAVGQSVVLRDGVYQITPFPWAGELEPLIQGEEYFLGGRTYQITEDVADALEGDGFTTDRSSGYGEGEYGDEGYGQ